MDVQDYDCGLLNDFGGGNVEWWFAYIRDQIDACNNYWRDQLAEEEEEEGLINLKASDRYPYLGHPLIPSMCFHGFNPGEPCNFCGR